MSEREAAAATVRQSKQPGAKGPEARQGRAPRGQLDGREARHGKQLQRRLVQTVDHLRVGALQIQDAKHWGRPISSAFQHWSGAARLKQKGLQLGARRLDEAALLSIAKHGQNGTRKHGTAESEIDTSGTQTFFSSSVAMATLCVRLATCSAVCPAQTTINPHKTPIQESVSRSVDQRSNPRCEHCRFSQPFRRNQQRWKKEQ